jgi:prevent-host-death family protein
MNLANNVKPISYLKSNTADIVKEITESGEPMLITQNGEPKLVLIDVKTYTEDQEGKALMALLALGHEEIKKGELVPADEVFAQLRAL